MKKVFLGLFLSVFVNVFSQDYRSPLDIPLQLSANFGELRNNHFHSGIDMKTQQVINKPVYSIADGFIS
ncbi:MAG TPA: M23 family peptidase, partial [Dysgonomonas sp.]|nr:M23 family peptidase [Dysgonomonas sp.]